MVHWLFKIPGNRNPSSLHSSSRIHSILLGHSVPPSRTHSVLANSSWVSSKARAQGSSLSTFSILLYHTWMVSFLGLLVSEVGSDDGGGNGSVVLAMIMMMVMMTMVMTMVMMMIHLQPKSSTCRFLICHTPQMVYMPENKGS